MSALGLANLFSLIPPWMPVHDAIHKMEIADLEQHSQLYQQIPPF